MSSIQTLLGFARLLASSLQTLLDSNVINSGTAGLCTFARVRSSNISFLPHVYISMCSLSALQTLRDLVRATCVSYGGSSLAGLSVWIYWYDQDYVSMWVFVVLTS